MITVYVLRSRQSGKRYVGITEDLERRMSEHRRSTSAVGKLLGASDVIHTETCPDYVTARLREKFLKSGQGRKWRDTSYPPVG